MISIRHAKQRGKSDLGWLDSNHTFSFAHYHDPAHMGFGPLRVINEDRVKPGAGFDTHGHRDMEILSFVIGGALEHKDSIGTGSVIRRGEIQRMSAGKGILHSEFNHSQEEQVHFLQIWIQPQQRGLAPGYEQKYIDPERGKNELTLIASPEGDSNAVRVHQDVSLYLGELEAGHELTYSGDAGRGIWLQIVAGDLTVNGQEVHAGDGVAVTEEANVNLKASANAEFLLFDLPMTD